jgi:hypothetical protein
MNGRERIVAATCVVMLATRRTRSLVAVSAVTERLVLLAPAPLILLVWFGSSIVHDIVLATSARVVSNPYRAYAHSRVTGEKEALSLIAPFPVALGWHVICFRYELIARVTLVSAYKSFWSIAPVKKEKSRENLAVPYSPSNHLLFMVPERPRLPVKGSSIWSAGL